jgi:ankyrin repeat protein
MNRTARSIEELFPIIAYARAGDLKNVKTWIDAGSPLNLPLGKKTKRQSPLQIAIEKGFLTLTEMLLDGGADPVSDTALRCAVNNGRADIVTLLLDRGAKLDDVSFEEVCYTRNIELVKLFLERGADPVAGAPFYGTLMCGLNPLLGFFKELLSKNPGLQPQADATLAYYASKGNPRGVGLMIWAGANPTTAIQLECEHEGQSALEVAANSGSVPTLKTMKPERFPAVLPKLMSAVAYHSSKEMREYLLSIGAPLNDSEDGSCSMLRSALYSIEWDSNSRFVGT